ncbi:MAG: hypothetical protein C4521_03855 [Actinobacteria bacterium]|nr:MAG: hypothetical protein C4521_03855 [Actinomycetota bacterium]
MLVPIGRDASQLQSLAAIRELENCNEVIGKHGLSLSETDVRALVAGRVEALQTTERIEFGGGVAKDLVLAFAGSPYVSQASFVEIILELQDLFYEVKNESLEQIPDDELIAKMRWLFDESAGGDLGYLEEALFEGLGRAVREEAVGDSADSDADNAAMNAATLAQHRFNVSDWVDETYSPGWEGSSWLDE